MNENHGKDNTTLDKKNRALQLFREKHYREARDLLVEISHSDESDIGAQYYLAIAHGHLCEYTAAEGLLRSVISKKPDLAEAYFNLANVLHHQKKPDEAEENFRRVLSLQPDHAGAYHGIGILQKDRGNLDASLDYMQRACRIQPDNPDLLIDMGRLRLKQGKHAEAINDLRNALKLSPNYGYAIASLGSALVLLGSSKEGRSLMEKGLGVNDSRIARLASREKKELHVIDSEMTPSGRQELTDVTIATSIAPRDFEIQREAIDSWKALGFEVISINCKEEISKLQNGFPDIEFHTAGRDARQQFGKPYIYFHDFMNLFEERGSKLCGIVNSDIHLLNKHLKTIVSLEAKNSFLFGCRQDVSTLDNNEGNEFSVGFDYFFFDRKYLSIYPRLLGVTGSNA
jgi:Tfp pilus assembly protein PilF